MSDFSISKRYEVDSIGAMRCVKMANAILSDIKGMQTYNSVPRSFKTYMMYSDSDGWMDVTIYAKSKGDRLYTVMRRDNKRKKSMVLDVRICADGRHLARIHTWDIEV
jgi:hypothetical protein